MARVAPVHQWRDSLKENSEGPSYRAFQTLETTKTALVGFRRCFELGRGKLNGAGKILIKNTISSDHFVLEY